MTGDPSRSAPIESLYPTQYEWLRRCPLHVAFDQQRRAAHGRRHRSDAQRLGDVAHDTLRRLVEDRSLLLDGWDEAFVAGWAAATYAVAAQDHSGNEPQKWANYEEKRQRTKRLASRVRELMLRHGPDGFFAERKLEAFSGRLSGIADLVIRTPTLHAVIDYKTGRVAGDDGSPMKGEYERQLLLYASIEAAGPYGIPGEVAIYPLKGPPVALEVTREACDEVSRDALAALAAFNTVAPGAQEARPSPDACPRCDFAPGCPAFWRAALDGVPTAEGRVAEVFIAERGGVSLGVDVTGGERIEILSIRPEVHQAATSVEPGDTVRFIGLEPLDVAGFFRLPAAGMLGTVAKL